MSSPSRPAVPAIDPYCDSQEAVEQECLRLAQDLHDDLGGRLVAVKMALASLLRPAQTVNTVNTDQLDAARRADRLLDEAVDAMHAVLHRLRPPALDLGLVAGLQQIADDFQSPALLSCHFSSNQPEIDAAPAVTMGVLRICREALANIGKHAQASRVDLRLIQTMAGGVDTLLLDIVDDGRGYPADAPDSASIVHRVQTLGGTINRRTGSVEGSGCHLHIRIPIARPPAPEAAKIRP